MVLSRQMAGVILNWEEKSLSSKRQKIQARILRLLLGGKGIHHLCHSLKYIWMILKQVTEGDIVTDACLSHQRHEKFLAVQLWTIDSPSLCLTYLVCKNNIR